MMITKFMNLIIDLTEACQKEHERRGHLYGHSEPRNWLDCGFQSCETFKVVLNNNRP